MHDDCIRFYFLESIYFTCMRAWVETQTLTIPQENLLLFWVVEHHTVEVPLLGVLDNSLTTSTTQR
jgi:hypothetical protein